MPPHVVAHVSDLHLDGGAQSFARARQVMRYLDELATTLEAVVITGDLAASGRPEEYAQVAELLASSRHPVFTCPGNHDTRAHYRAGLLGEEPDDAPVNRMHRTDRVVFAMCDSIVPGEHAGHLDDATLAWLDGVLAGASPGVPVVVALHHPPVPLHNPVLDGMRLQGEERLAAVLAAHANVAAVLCGHAHTAASTTFAGRPLRVAPGVASTLSLPWEPGELLDPARPPGLAFHVLDGGPPDWRVVTHYRTLPMPITSP